MQRSTLLPTSFSKLENNPAKNDQELSRKSDMPVIVSPPPPFDQSDVISADNRSGGEMRLPTQDMKYRDLSERFVRPAAKRPTNERAHILRARQRWEGTVTEVNGEEFTAILTDLSNPRNSDEEAVLNLDELVIQDDDLPLLKPGASFYWIVGTEKSPAGVVKNVSFLEFKRIPKWSTSALSRAKSRSNNFGSLFASSE